MQYVHAEHSLVHEQQPLWLRWFLDSVITDEAALRAALRVVPAAFWSSVHRDISRGLAELSATLEGQAGTATSGVASTLAMKRLLLSQENARRDAGAAPRSPLV
jgi:hypothetical protein